MFGISALFAALNRLTASINTSAALFDAANSHLARQLSIDGSADAPALPAPGIDMGAETLRDAAEDAARDRDAARRNGRKAKQTA